MLNMADGEQNPTLLCGGTDACASSSVALIGFFYQRIDSGPNEVATTSSVPWSVTATMAQSICSRRKRCRWLSYVAISYRRTAPSKARRICIRDRYQFRPIKVASRPASDCGPWEPQPKTAGFSQHNAPNLSHDRLQIALR